MVKRIFEIWNKRTLTHHQHGLAVVVVAKAPPSPGDLSLSLSLSLFLSFFEQKKTSRLTYPYGFRV
jgi:hypothetical protein